MTLSLYSASIKISWREMKANSTISYIRYKNVVSEILWSFYSISLVPRISLNLSVTRLISSWFFTTSNSLFPSLYWIECVGISRASAQTIVWLYCVTRKVSQLLRHFDIAYILSVMKLTATCSEWSFLFFENQRTILQMTTGPWDRKNVAYYRCQDIGIGNGEHDK